MMMIVIGNVLIDDCRFKACRFNYNELRCYCYINECFLILWLDEFLVLLISIQVNFMLDNFG